MNDSAAVVVGIGYPSDDAKTHNERRSLDLTPPASPEWLKTLPKGVSTGKTGGCDEFLAFIETELKPMIEKKYTIDRKRLTLFGYSFGGLFTLHVLFTKPEAFQTYLASSPSIWWNSSLRVGGRESVRGEVRRKGSENATAAYGWPNGSRRRERRCRGRIARGRAQGSGYG